MDDVSEVTAADLLPVTSLKRVGPRVAERLARLGIHTVQDVLFHLPLRYEDRTHHVPIGALRPGQAALVRAQIELAQVRFGRRRSLLVRISDGTGTLTLRFFHFSRRQQAALQRGATIECFGEARPGGAGLEMVHPDYRLGIDLDAAEPGEATLTPVYPATEGVRQPTLRGLARQAVDRLLAGSMTLTDWIPAPLRSRHGLPELTAAVVRAHRPPAGEQSGPLHAGALPYQRRLAFDELLAHHLSLRQLRAQARRHHAPRLDPPGRLWAALQEALPFALTGAQRRVIGEIRTDLVSEAPMLRLLQGDVGAGKTVVAAAALLQAVESGWQAAIIAPTELLAEQHHRSFRQWLEPLGVNIAWLTGRLPRAARNAALAALADGSAQIAIGTHALFQEEATFQALGLTIIDEQHRFGVHQRLAMRDKGADGRRRPHQLIMTATPIPRTLAMSIYADLDLSVLDELPPGRQPVTTVVLPERRRDEVLARVREQCLHGRQAYWVCTLIDSSEALEAQAAEETATRLEAQLPGLRVGLVHGRMKGAEREQTMAAFVAGEIHLLVATTVIEVGVDVPNASLMIIENAERLGLSQLHQLRGRVGRGTAQSFCVLLHQPAIGQIARRRLAILRDSADGFVIARADLEIRGPGEVLGTRQTGDLQLRIADLMRDQEMLPAVHACAEALLAEHPDHVAPLIGRWLGTNTRFGDV